MLNLSAVVAVFRRRNGRELQPALTGARWQLLCALQSVARGNALVVWSDPDSQEREVVCFDGHPLPRIVGPGLLARGWIQPSQPHWMPGLMIYRLSPLGEDA